MRPLSLDQLLARSDDIDRAIEATAGIDPWCSALDWIVPVHLAFAPSATPILREAPSGFALLARYPTSEGRSMIAGLEPLWGFAAPLLGRDQGAVAAELAAELLDDTDWDTLALPGLPPARDTVMRIARSLAVLGDVGLQEGITRQIIDLEDGATAWLERRSPKFRRNLRNAQRRGRDVGLDFEIVDDAPDLFDRIHAIERTSWKGAQGDGITSPEMSEFYRVMSQRLQGAGRARAVVATMHGSDVGYILGGVRDHRYRGLQLSYAAEAGSLSLGHLLQRHELHRMAAEGIATYDMGMDMAYKQRMADRSMTSVMLVVRRDVTGYVRHP
ncbi:MAG: GNAT family N-acetyltransferase [Acidimicrobiales bacterium]